MSVAKKILVTGGAGYVGSVLVPKLLSAGYEVNILDLYIYGENVLDSVKNNPALKQIKGDIRDIILLRKIVPGNDVIIHLACISNDPSCELDPLLTKSINYTAFLNLVKIASQSGVKRFIFVSSSSVYGIKDTPDVTEEMPLAPLTDYSKYKALCEEDLLKYQSKSFTTVILRPATVCGYSSRLRLDLTVNILTSHAINEHKIKIFGGSQKRPNIHIDDITDYYVKLIDLPNNKIAGKIFNAGYENYTLCEIAEMVRENTDKNIPVEFVPTDDIRSYHISSEKIKRELQLVPQKTINDAIMDLKNAFQTGKIKNWQDKIYYNVRQMKAINLQ